MQKLTREDLLSLEQYAQQRDEFRNKVMIHKKNRRVALGPHLNLYFEDRLIMQYQIQEMLRVEKIFEPQGIQEELDAYNPLIPDGNNWKATMMLEYDDPEQRKKELQQLVGIEDTVWVQVDGHERVFAIADEDLERSNQEKTSSVHFLRFELSEAMCADLKKGVALKMGVEHNHFSHPMATVNEQVRDSLVQDLG